MKEIRDIIAAFDRLRGERFALATLVRTRGSSYRRPGARMLIATDRSTVGALSGGCLEEEVAARAQQVITTGASILLRFDTRLRYGCNGAIDIFVEKLEPNLLAQLAAAQRERRVSWVATVFENSDTLGSRFLAAPAATPAKALVQMIPPPLRLVLIGEGPDSPPLRDLANVLGWMVMEAEDAGSLPNDLDEWTAVVVKTHNYGRDYAALEKLLPVGLPYVALLGPRRRRDQLLHTLLETGLTARSELFSPAGLDLAAESPEEIALAIIAEIQSVFARASVESLRARKCPIHPPGEAVVAPL
jgi:xanthine dehydrogenase accessory factor